MRVHVVGNLCRDTTLAVDRFPVPGETLVARSSAVGLGGKGLNQAVAAARAGADATLHAAVCRDDAAALDHVLEGEDRLTLRLAGLALPTDTSTLLVRPDGENVIVSATACALAFDAIACGVFGTVAAGNVLLMQGNLSASTTSACLRLGRSQKTLTILNPSPLSTDEHPDWRDVDLVVANAGELEALTGEVDPDAGATALLRHGALAVVVTLGPRGAVYRDAAHRIEVVAPSVTARDTSGAGDVFCGVLAGLLACGRERGEALARATVAASLSVTRPGALASSPTTAEIAALSLPCPIRSLP